MSKLFKPKINTPQSAAAPAQPTLEAPVQELGGNDEVKLQQRKKKGRNALRIDPQTGGVPSGGGSGINVPMK